MAIVSIVASFVALAALVALHVLSPEFDPSWRMVSEYAKGHYGEILSAMFAAWAVSSFSLAWAIRSQASSFWYRFALAFLVVAGIGETMGALFDIRHPLHSWAALLGIPSLPIAALVIGSRLRKLDSWAPVHTSVLWTSHWTWISFVLMGASFLLLMVTYAQSGASSGADVEWTALPAGVVGVVGWANRLLIVAYCLWALVVATHAFRLARGRKAKNSAR